MERLKAMERYKGVKRGPARGNAAWKAKVCKDSGKPYYECQNTGVRSWEKQHSSMSRKSSGGGADDDWEEATDDHGGVFFVNKKTKRKTFAAPIIDGEHAQRKGEWIHEHDEEFDRDYFVNVRTRVATWTDHSAEL